MGHFSVIFVKTKIFYGPFNFCMGHLQNYKTISIKRPMAPAFPNHWLSIFVEFSSYKISAVSIILVDKELQ